MHNTRRYGFTRHGVYSERIILYALLWKNVNYDKYADYVSLVFWEDKNKNYKKTPTSVRRQKVTSG